MPTAVSTRHAKFSEAIRGDDNCHLHIGITIKPLTRHTPQLQPWPPTRGCPRQETIYTLCTYIILSAFMLIIIDPSYFLPTDTVSTFTVSLGKRKVIGKMNRTRTGFPYCRPGTHLGIEDTTRTASLSR